MAEEKSSEKTYIDVGALAKELREALDGFKPALVDLTNSLKNVVPNVQQDRKNEPNPMSKHKIKRAKARKKKRKTGGPR